MLNPEYFQLIILNKLGDPMKLTTLLLTIVLSLSLPLTGFSQESASGEVSGKCKYPKQPEIPNGRTATEAELVAAQKEMKAYIKEGDEYIACISKVEESWGSEASDDQKAIIVLFNNKVVDDMQAVADLFNAAVRAYKGQKK
jgi:hypothetical protein